MDGVAQTGPTRYAVTRAFVDHMIDDQNDVFRKVRLVPEQQNGNAVGIRIFGIEAGSTLDRLGLRNGDRLDALNGYPMSSPEKALEAYATLRTAEQIILDVTRAGAPVKLVYDVQ
jgi:general secretion pathway protein C